MQFEPAKCSVPPEPLGFRELLRAAARNPLEIVPEAAYSEPIVTQRTLGKTWHMVTDPVLLRQVYKDNVANYPKAPIMHRLLDPYLGKSIFLADGEGWRWRRRALAPMFKQQKVAKMLAPMVATAERTADRLLGAEGPVNIAEEMRRVAMDVVRDTIYCDLHDAEATGGENSAYLNWIDVKSELDDVIRSFGAETLKISLADLVNWPRWLPRLGGKRAHPMDAPRRITEAFIAARRESGYAGDDLASLMLAAEDPETGRRLTDEELRDDLLTFVLAGSDTTALALTWALYLLSRSPEAQERVRAEAEAALSGGWDGETLGELGFTRRVLDEAMRLYPPAPHLTRQARAKDQLGETRIRKGAIIVTPVYTIHRHRALWDNPDMFDPDRFLPERSEGRPRFAYIPFGLGPRVCIAPTFALAEATAVLAILVRRIRFDPVMDRPVIPIMRPTLKPKGGMPLYPVDRG